MIAGQLAMFEQPGPAAPPSLDPRLDTAAAQLAEALDLIDQAATALHAAHAAAERDRRGRLASARGLRLWGALHGLSTATRSIRTAHRTCTTHHEETTR